jgi:hypothetical protein
MQLLSRSKFGEAVFDRDQRKCVICGEAGVDAHHILERRLFEDGGYYLDNGATLCALHHLAAEDTSLSCSSIRTAAKITKVILPERLEEGLDYDKWGNVVLADGKRLKGPLFFEEPVQKMLTQSNSLSLFLPYVIALRPRNSSILACDFIQEKEVLCYADSIGEICSFYHLGVHLHPFELCTESYRPEIYQFWKNISPEIPTEWRLVGKVQLVEQQVVFQLQSIWNAQNECLSWAETAVYAELLNLPLPTVVYQGIYELLPPLVPNASYILRLADEFDYRQANLCILGY